MTSRTSYLGGRDVTPSRLDSGGYGLASARTEAVKSIDLVNRLPEVPTCRLASTVGFVIASLSRVSPVTPTRR